MKFPKFIICVRFKIVSPLVLVFCCIYTIYYGGERGRALCALTALRAHILFKSKLITFCTNWVYLICFQLLRLSCSPWVYREKVAVVAEEQRQTTLTISVQLIHRLFYNIITDYLNINCILFGIKRFMCGRIIKCCLF